jgi:hypothetical protein
VQAGGFLSEEQLSRIKQRIQLNKKLHRVDTMVDANLKLAALNTESSINDDHSLLYPKRKKLYTTADKKSLEDSTVGISNRELK